MQLVNKSLKLDNLDEEGVQLIPGQPEDMWHLHNLIGVDDIVKAHAVRKVIRETDTGSVDSKRVHVSLTVRVKSTFFDPVASTLNVSGVVINENDHVNLGSHHTLDLELQRPFTLWKPNGWDSVAIDTLREAITAQARDALAAVVMDLGLANVCLITDYQTIIKQRVEMPIPKKLMGSKDATSALGKFHAAALAALLQHADFSNPRPLLLASPGFVAENFRKYIEEEGRRTSDKKLLQMAKGATVAHSSTGYVHSLNEILKNPQVKASIGEKKFAKETALMDRFYERLREDDGRAWYGVKPVEKAVAMGYVSHGGVLLINNALFRSMDLATRKRYVALVDKVKEDGGEARILSSDHESGKRLDALGGIAALLSFAIQDLDDSEDETG